MHKVMLIEDDETMLSLIHTLLSIEGFQVVQIDRDQDLAGAFEAVRRERPSLVLLDVNLCYFNGLDLLRRVRQADDIKDTRVLMSSGMEVSQQCLNEGADGFILKPFMPDELIDQIREIVG